LYHIDVRKDEFTICINYKKAKLFETSIILLIKKFLLKITKVNLNRSTKKIK